MKNTVLWPHFEDYELWKALLMKIVCVDHLTKLCYLDAFDTLIISKAESGRRVSV